MSLLVNLKYLSATELISLIKNKEISPVELIEYTINLIEKRNPSLNALIYFGFDDAIVKYEPETHGDGTTSCKITSRTQPESKNGDNQGGDGFRMSGEFFYKMAEHVKKTNKLQFFRYYTR